MNITRLFVWLFVLMGTAAASSAQNTPVTTTVSSIENGRVQVAIINDGHEPITGLTVVGELIPLADGIAHSILVRGIDAVIGPLDHPLMPKGTCAFVFGVPDAPDRARFEVSLKAAVFADGSTFGEAEWIDRLIQHRRYLYRHVDAALQFLSYARRAPNSREQVIQNAEEFKASELMFALNREEQRVIRHVFDAISLNLKVDEPRDGSFFPVADRLGVTVDQFTQLRPTIAGLEAHHPLNIFAKISGPLPRDVVQVQEPERAVEVAAKILGAARQNEAQEQYSRPEDEAETLGPHDPDADEQPGQPTRAAMIAPEPAHH